MKQPASNRAPVNLSFALLLVISACTTPPSQPSVPLVVKPARIPPLPEQARQHRNPESCSPTCSEVLEQKLDATQRSLTQLSLPEKPASAPTTR